MSTTRHDRRFAAMTTRALTTGTLALLLATGSQVASAQSARGASPDWKAFDRYAAQAARDWRVPALAIAVVKDGELVFAKGYGTLETGTSRRADEHTRFAIGSTTKAMTSAALAMLVDEGKVSWDDRVIDHIPEFRLHDAYATRELTIRDLLLHRSGLPGTDLFWVRWNYSMPEMMHRLRYVQPTSSFRSRWQYQNVVYAIAGVVIERVSGMSWDAFMRERLLQPLGMTETEPLVADIIGKPNVAVPHRLINDTLRVVPIRTTDSIAPSGSVYSSVSDMSRWMRFMLDSGRVGSNRLISAETFQELVAPQIRAPIGQYPALQLARPHSFNYSLGWFVQNYRGQQVWMHTGSINGMSAIVGLLPDQRAGVFILANLDHAELRHALMYQVFDLYAGGPSRDWSKDLRALLAASGGGARAVATPAGANERPALPLDRYAGTYTDPANGTVRVTVAAGTLQAQIVNDPVQELGHWRHDSFRIPAQQPGSQPTILTFVPDGMGNIAAVRISGVTFAREGDRR